MMIIYDHRYHVTCDCLNQTWFFLRFALSVIKTMKQPKIYFGIVMIGHLFVKILLMLWTTIKLVFTYGREVFLHWLKMLVYLFLVYLMVTIRKIMLFQFLLPSPPYRYLVNVPSCFLMRIFVLLMTDIFQTETNGTLNLGNPTSRRRWVRIVVPKRVSCDMLNVSDCAKVQVSLVLVFGSRFAQLLMFVFKNCFKRFHWKFMSWIQHTHGLFRFSFTWFCFIVLHVPLCSLIPIARGRNLENIRFVEPRRFQIHYRSHYGMFSAFLPNFLICVMTKHTFNVFFEMSKEITKSLMTVQEGGHRYRLSGPPRYNLGNLDSTAIGWQTVACSHGMWQASLCNSEGSFQLWHDDVQKLLCRSSATLSQKPDRSQHAAPSPLHSSRRMMGAISAGEATSRVHLPPTWSPCSYQKWSGNPTKFDVQDAPLRSTWQSSCQSPIGRCDPKNRSPAH